MRNFFRNLSEGGAYLLLSSIIVSPILVIAVMGTSR